MAGDYRASGTVTLTRSDGSTRTVAVAELLVQIEDVDDLVQITVGGGLGPDLDCLLFAADAGDVAALRSDGTCDLRGTDTVSMSDPNGEARRIDDALSLDLGGRYAIFGEASEHGAFALAITGTLH